MNKKVKMLIWGPKVSKRKSDRKGTEVHLPQRTSASDPCVAARIAGGRWCRESCSQRSYHGGEGKSGRYGCHISVRGKTKEKLESRLTKILS